VNVYSITVKVYLLSWHRSVLVASRVDDIIYSSDPSHCDDPH